MGCPFAYDRAGDAIGQQLVVESFRAFRKAGGSEQQKGSGRQYRQQRPSHRQSERCEAGREVEGAHEAGIVQANGCRFLRFIYFFIHLLRHGFDSG